MLSGWKTSLGRCHSFLASLMATPPLLFHTITMGYSSRPSNSGVVTVKAHVGAAMYTRSTHGCGTLAGPSLESEGFRLQTQKGCADTARQPRFESSRSAWKTKRDLPHDCSFIIFFALINQSILIDEYFWHIPCIIMVGSSHISLFS